MLRISELALQRVAPLLEGIRNVLQEQQTEHQVLVLGRLDAATELVGRLKERRAVGAVDTSAQAITSEVVRLSRSRTELSRLYFLGSDRTSSPSA